MQTTAERPDDVTSLAKMAIGSGVLGILVGLALLILTPMLDVIGSDSPGLFGLGLFATLYILGAFVIVAGIVSVVFGVGAWRLKPWAWPLGVALYAVIILLSLAPVILGWLDIQAMLINLLIGAVCLYLLFTPAVRRAFGRG